MSERFFLLRNQAGSHLAVVGRAGEGSRSLAGKGEVTWKLMPLETGRWGTCSGEESVGREWGWESGLLGPFPNSPAASEPEIKPIEFKGKMQINVIGH